MPPSTKPKRIAIACSLPPDLAARLAREAEDRMLNQSAFIEKALNMYLPTLPALEPDES